MSLKDLAGAIVGVVFSVPILWLIFVLPFWDAQTRVQKAAGQLRTEYMIANRRK